MKFIDCISKFAHLAPGCPEPELVDALRFAVIEFCESTHILTEWVQKTAGDLTFDTAGEAGRIPIAIFDAYVGEYQADILHLNAAALKDATAERPAITYRDSMLATSLAITPAPVPSTQVRLLTSFAPNPDANEYPDHLWTMKRDALRSGALARLLSEPGTKYANEGLSVKYRSEFEAAISKAATAASVNRRTSAVRLRVTPR